MEFVITAVVGMGTIAVLYGGTYGMSAVWYRWGRMSPTKDLPRYVVQLFFLVVLMFSLLVGTIVRDMGGF